METFWRVPSMLMMRRCMLAADAWWISAFVRCLSSAITPRMIVINALSSAAMDWDGHVANGLSKMPAPGGDTTLEGVVLVELERIVLKDSP